MMRSALSLRTPVSPFAYAAIAPVLLLAPHVLVWGAHRALGTPLVPDLTFWLLPLRRLAELPGLPPWVAALSFLFGLLVTWALAALSFRRASHAGYGHSLAIATILPVFQIIAVIILAFAPMRQTALDLETPSAGINTGHVLQGVLAGVAIIVLAVLVSAVTFGAYGWGLFVATPFLVGVTTAYLANRETVMEVTKTIGLVMIAAALGSLALIMFALEGFICIVLAAPLGAIVAAAGGAVGRWLAMLGHKTGRPLFSIAILPAVFMLEGAVPPAIAIDTGRTITIDAAPADVWATLISDSPIGPKPALISAAGFAYAISGHLTGEGVGAERIGQFSTGTARERVTQWTPGRKLSLTVLSQPPMMEEMSPYRRVHAPHVMGYFVTTDTSFELERLPRQRTRLTVRATHILRIDPALYWEPMARWAIRENVDRVLLSVKTRTEQQSD
jgi:hypothetical protein